MNTTKVTKRRKRCSMALTHTEIALPVSMYKFCSLDEVCEYVFCVSVLFINLNSVAQFTYFPPLLRCFSMIM